MASLYSRGVNSSLWPGDSALGPVIGNRFDFTLLFEHAILTALPASLILVASPLYIFRFWKTPVSFNHGLLLWSKIAAAAILVGLELANIVCISLEGSILQDPTSIAASVLSMVSMIAVMAIVYAEHRRSLRSSSLLGAFLSITTLFNVARARSYFIRTGLKPFGSIQAAIALFKLALVAMEEVSKQSLLIPGRKSSSIGPEMQRGFWNRSLFIWINNILSFGFKNVIRSENLPSIGQEFATETLSAKFQASWQKVNKSSKYCLPIASMRALAWPFVAIVVPRLCFMAFNFAQPFLLHTIVALIGADDLRKDVVGGLIAATALVYFGLAVTRAMYTHAVYRCLTMNRGMLVSAVFKHTLELDLVTAKKSAAVTLMSTDVDSIGSAFVTMHDLWAGFIELAVGVYLLARYVGAAAFLISVPAVLSTVSSQHLAKKNGPARKAWNQAVQKRVAAVNHTLGQTKNIKMCGLGPTVATSLQDLRVAEVKKSKLLRRIIIYMTALAQFFETNTPVLVIAGSIFWTNGSKTLNAADIFATISLTRLVSSPMTTLLLGLPQVTSLFACFSRIQSFLLLEACPGVSSPVASGRETPSSNTMAQDTVTFNGEPNEPVQACEKDQPFMEMRNVSIYPSADAEAVLHNVDLQIQRSSVTVIVGPVASGKTTLLRAILGESRTDGFVMSAEGKDTGYCDQVPWLKNVSIRDNITNVDEFDSAWYQTVLRSCLLDEDLQQLSEGDATLAGSGGANLSGGQKQRVALARALYARKSVLVLDDVFSALDHQTSHSILGHLLGEDGVLRRLGTTVVVATHSPNVVAIADKVVILDGHGNVNTRDEAQDTTSRVALIKELRQTYGVLGESDQSQQDVDPKNTVADRQEKEKPNPTKDAKKLERQRGDLGLYRFYFFSSGIWNYISWLAMVAISMLWGQMPLIFLRIWLDRAPEDKTYFAGYATLGITSCLSSGVMLAYYMLKVAPSSAEKLHWIFVKTVMSATIGFLSSTDSGALLNRFSQDMSLINQALPLVLLNFAIILFDSIVSAGVIFSGASYAAVVIPFLLLTIYLVQHFYLRTSRQMRHLDLESKSPVYTQFTETAAGVQHIRAFSWQTETLAQSYAILDQSQKPYYYMYCIQRWLTLVLELSVSVVAVVLVTLALNLPHTSSASAIGLALVNMIGFGSNMADVMAAWTRLETSLGAIARLRSFVNETPTENEPENAPDLPPDWPQHGRITLSHVSARYNRQDEGTVLENLSLDIKPGQKVGIVGRTGSGKSSFILTLLHLLEYSGMVTIDGIDTSDIMRQQLRSRITVLSQDPIELQGSARHNMAPFTGAHHPTDDEMQDSLVQVGLWDHVSSKGGLDSEYSALGLSQGQRQLFCLARAVLHQRKVRSKIVLIDEATSNVDADTDKKMQAVMRAAFLDCTVITVAHRLNTIQDVDIVLEFDSGRLVRQEDRAGPQ